MAFLQIITDNILPLLIFVAIGYFMDRRFRLDVNSLTKLTFYIILPCFIFYSIYVAKIDFSLFHVFIISLVLMAMLGAIGTLIAKARNWDAGKREAFKNGTMFSNAGNIGIALIALVFSNAPYVTESGTPYLAEAAAVSTLVLVQMNMFLNTLGLYQAGKGSLSPHDALRVVLHMPVIYTLTAAFAVKSIGIDLSGTFIWPILQNCAAALVAVVMMHSACRSTARKFLSVILTPGLPALSGSLSVLSVHGSSSCSGLSRAVLFHKSLHRRFSSCLPCRLLSIPSFTPWNSIIMKTSPRKS